MQLSNIPYKHNMSRVNNTQTLLNHYLKTALNIVSYFDKKDERDKMLKELEKVIKENCVYDEKLKKLTDTIKELTENISEDQSPEEVIEEFKNKKEEILRYQPNATNHPNLIQYRDQVKEILNDADGNTRDNNNDDDLQVTQRDINVIDPFTKKRMTDPVKNKICGHTYDRESVISILKMKKDTRCPVIGCINKEYILEENLLSDVTTKKYLQKN